MFMRLPWRAVSFSEGAAEVSHDTRHLFRRVVRQAWLCLEPKYHPPSRVGTIVWERGHLLQNIDGIYFYIYSHFTLNNKESNDSFCT